MDVQGNIKDGGIQFWHLPYPCLHTWPFKMDWVATFFHSSAFLSSDYVHIDLCVELLRCLCDFQDPVFQQICHLMQILKQGKVMIMFLWPWLANANLMSAWITSYLFDSISILVKFSRQLAALWNSVGNWPPCQFHSPCQRRSIHMYGTQNMALRRNTWRGFCRKKDGMIPCRVSRS